MNSARRRKGRNDAIIAPSFSLSTPSFPLFTPSFSLSTPSFLIVPPSFPLSTSVIPAKAGIQRVGDAVRAPLKIPNFDSRERQCQRALARVGIRLKWTTITP